MLSENALPQNTLDLAKQGDPTAIATLLTYGLSRFSATASVIRLGNYLSVLVDTPLAADQGVLVKLVLDILQDLSIEAISTIEVSARRTGDQEVLWSQTIELATHTPTAMNELTSESASSIPASANPVMIEAAGDQEGGGLDELLQRPEMLALVAFALILLLWESYSEWMAADDLTKPMTGVKLARRLGISSSTLSRYRGRSNFSEWSQELDPNGIAWVYEGKIFMPKPN